jgi:hypothetical protein
VIEFRIEVGDHLDEACRRFWPDRNPVIGHRAEGAGIEVGVGIVYRMDLDSSILQGRHIQDRHLP